MSIERITLNFDADDENSMILCNILKEIKRGHRMEVIADNVLSILDEHNFLGKYADNPTMMAKFLMMFSENYRATKNSAFTTSEDWCFCSSGRVGNAKRTKNEARKSDNKDCKKTISVSADKATIDNAIKEMPDKQPVVIGNQHIPPDQWTKAMNKEAITYFRSNMPKEQFETYEEALRMLGDDDDKYEELVISPGLILSGAVPLPSDNMTFEEWITKQLNQQGLYEE